MPTLNVVMGQAVCTANLGANSLMTGAGEAGDRIQSCAAIIMVNTGTGAAGLYHYPSGNINDHRPGAQTVIQQMVQRITPTRAYIIYGIAHAPPDPGNLSAADPYANELREYVRGQLPNNITLSRRPARNGFASVSIAGGQEAIGYVNIDPCTDIRGTQAGNHHLGGMDVAVMWDGV